MNSMFRESLCHGWRMGKCHHDSLAFTPMTINAVVTRIASETFLAEDSTPINDRYPIHPSQLLQNSYQTPTTIIQRSINEASPKHHDSFPFPRKTPKKSLIPDFPPIPHLFYKFPQLLPLSHPPFHNRKCDEYPLLPFPSFITKHTPRTSSLTPPRQPAHVKTLPRTSHHLLP